jgi:CDGSH-type Zn-finger protein
VVVLIVVFSFVRLGRVLSSFPQKINVHVVDKESYTQNKERNIAMVSKNDKREIIVSRNGPYLVFGEVPILEQIIVADSEGTANEWREGKKYQYKEKCGLCRCGKSKNKPFCDGTHQKVSFDSTETADDELSSSQIKEIDGPTLKLKDSEILCASARFCHREGGIWNLVPKSSSDIARRIAIEEACNCPSGRLVVRDKKTGREFEPKMEPSIGLIEDPQVQCSGPIWVRGGIPIRSADGKIYEARDRVTLCRCGKSSNKPFCDSSHFHEHRYEEMISRK